MSGRASGARDRRIERHSAASDLPVLLRAEPDDFPQRIRIQSKDKSPGRSRGGGSGGRQDGNGHPRANSRQRDDRPKRGGGGGGMFSVRGRMDSQRNGQMDGRGGKLYTTHDQLGFSDVKTQQDISGKSFLDDNQLLKLSRRVSREEDRERRLAVIQQLTDYLRQPDNTKAIMTASENLLTSLHDIFYERINKEIKQAAATCLGVLGSAMASQIQRYVQWLLGKLTAASTDEAKIHLLRALLQTMEDDSDKGKMADLMPLIMSDSQIVLENADVPELLIAVVNVIKHITSTYPHVFSANFRDTVDILVGWHIDATQKQSLTQHTSEALISFHHFWIADLPFSLTLLGQFLEDMEAYTEDLGLGLIGSGTSEEDMVPTPDECLTKIAALLRVYSTVAQCLGEYFSPEHSVDITWDSLLDNLERVITCVESAIQKIYSEKVLIAVNSCLSLLTVRLASVPSRLCASCLLPFLVNRLRSSSRHHSNTYLVSLLTLVQKVIDMLTTHLPVVFVNDVLAADSILHSLHFSHSSQMMRQLMCVYHALMNIKSVPLLQEVYRHVLGDLQIGYQTLLAAAGSTAVCTLVADNPYSGITYSVREAEAVVIFGICALSEIGNTKNNLIAMYALSPSVFELLAIRLLPSHMNALSHFPAVHYSVLLALYSHSSRHGHFIASSNLVTAPTMLDGSHTVGTATGCHFVTELSLLSGLITPQLPFDSCRLCLRWVEEITNSVMSFSNVIDSSHFQDILSSLVTLGFSGNAELSIGAARCLQTAVSATCQRHYQRITEWCLQLCGAKLSHADDAVRKAYFDLLKALPADIITGNFHGKMAIRRDSSGRYGVRRHAERYLAASRAHMLKAGSGGLHAHDFRTAMSFILNGIYPEHIGSAAWLQRVYYSCQGVGQNAASTQLTSADLEFTSLMCGSDGALWQWLCVEAGQFCVQSRLRTPLGRPQQTLTSIEAALKRGAAWLNDGEEAKPANEAHDTSGADNATYLQKLQLHALLQFMEYLQKSLYNAYEGCAVAMPAPQKAVRTFFRTNRGTCEEWLSRVRGSLIRVAEHCQQAPLVVRHASQMLADMAHSNTIQTSEMDSVLYQMTWALCQLRCPEALHGLYAWCRQQTGRKLGWIKTAAELANGRYEVAISEFKVLLKTHMCPPAIADDIKDALTQDNSPIGSPKHTSRAASGDGLHHFSILSKQVEPDSPDPVFAGFLAKQVCDSYVRLCSWSDVLAWQDTLQQYRSENTSGAIQRAFYLNIDINYIKALSAFDSRDFVTARAHLELVPDTSVNCQLGDNITAASSQLVRAITLGAVDGWKDNRESVTQYLCQCEQWCERALQLNALNWPQNLQSDVLLQLRIASACHQQMEQKLDKGGPLLLCGEIKLDAPQHDVGSLLRLLDGLKLQAYLQTALDTQKTTDVSHQIHTVRLATCRLARRQCNFQLAERLIFDELGISCHDNRSLLTDLHVPLTQLSDVPSIAGPPSAVCLLRIGREASKLLYACGHHHKAIDTLVSALTPPDEQTAELTARSLLTLATWLQADQQRNVGTALSSNVSDKLSDIVKWSTTWQGSVHNSQSDVSIDGNAMMSENDTLIGRLLHMSSRQAPQLAKSWFALAGWCYKWGRKAVDSAVHGNVELLTEEKTQILELLPKGTNAEETESVLNVLSQIHMGLSNDEDISDQDQSLYDDCTETTRRQLLAVCVTLQVTSDDSVERLLGVWHHAVQRVYAHYQLAANAYFTFLTLNAQDSEDVTTMDGNVTATLRVLRLLVKHAWELRGVLETGLAHTPTAPWKGIIPQLLSRLNHPEPYVRQSVSELLCRVALDAPHLIAYPAVVGCSSSKVQLKDSDALLNDYLSQAAGDEHAGDSSQTSPVIDDDVTDTVTDDTMLQNCFASIVNTLANTNPGMMEQVQLLVCELRRVTLLWDELWLGTLNQHHADVTRRLTQLEHELAKVTANLALSREDRNAIVTQIHDTVLKPTVFVLERLHDITSGPAETNHERWFQQTYGDAITAALDRLKHPPNAANPQNSWALFKQLHHSLQQRAAKRSSLVLNMAEISSKLANLKSTSISMPGLHIPGQMVTIEGIHNAVQILPTKTKPKKLIFIGSDGNKYPYLFKGLEDLHLDERIMQFLSIVNNMFARANRHDRQLLQARHYSVTPLGARSGLIHWVDGATPLFSLYKRWQQREAAAAQLRLLQSSTGAANAPPIVIPRPSEVFYGKMTPALKEKGISNLENRKEWPMCVMRAVLESLMNDTPNDLLSRELWCSSTSACQWWQVMQTYARSTAVMSMIGYIIGLGDRHLDNVLVDLATGEVVHIDYNVCFEKGKSLRVPERVPFRMTQNIEHAFGVTGVEGVFRLSCEHVLRTLRRGRETLLTLLEAFVYDPLIDWTTSNESGYTGAFYGGGGPDAGGEAGRQSKEEMERDITLSMFSIRVAQMRAAWTTNRAAMLSSLPRMLSCVRMHVDAHTQLTAAEKRSADYAAQVAYLESAMQCDKHDAFTLQQRYAEYSVVKHNRLAIEQAMQEKLNECDQWYTGHQFALNCIRDGKLQKMCATVTRPLDLCTFNFDKVVQFLQHAGQASMVVQCEQVARELTAGAHQQRALLRNCLDILHTYATIVSQYPVTYLDTCRNTKYQQWLQELICDFTSDKCRRIVSEFEECYGVSSVLRIAPQKVMAVESKIQAVINDVTAGLSKLLDRRNLEATKTSALTLLVQESKNAIYKFIMEEQLADTGCVSSVLASALCSLSKRYIIMEGAAAAAGEHLMDLTSRDGDWFLDELCSMSANVSQMLELLTDPAVCPLANDVQCQQMAQALRTTHTVYLTLQDLNVNFRTIILPETMKALGSKDESVLSIIDSLTHMLVDCVPNVDVFIGQLEAQLARAILHNSQEALDECVLAPIYRLRARFSELFQEPGTSKADIGSAGCMLSSGQMLLMAFNGLFVKLDADFGHVLETFSQLLIPANWHTVDVVAEATSLQVVNFSDRVGSLLSHIFFVYRLQAMLHFFQLCRQLVSVIQGQSSGHCFDDDHLAKPVRHFIANYIRKHMIGLPSQALGCLLCVYVESVHINVGSGNSQVGAPLSALDELCRRAVEQMNMKSHVHRNHLATASSLVTAFDLSWRKLDLARRLDGNAALLHSNQQRVQLELARVQWLNEDVYSHAARPLAQMAAPARATIMAELHKSLQALTAHQAVVTTAQERHLQLENGITQRLKWASGANPSLASTLRLFEEAIATKNTVIKMETSLTVDVLSMGNALLHFEALRTRTPEALAADAAFLALINRCDECCILVETCGSSVSETEDAIISNKDCDTEISRDWLMSVLEQTRQKTGCTGTEVDTLRTETDNTKEGVRGQVNEIRSILATHHKLMLDVRSILKSMAKYEEQEQVNGEVVSGGICDYVNSYKTFSENFTAMLKLVMADSITADVLVQITEMTSTLNEQITRIYDDLLLFAPPLKGRESDAAVPQKGSLLNAVKKTRAEDIVDAVSSPLKTAITSVQRPELLTGTPINVASPQPTGRNYAAKKVEKVTRDPKTGKAIQERNSYAVSVWKRVKMKLDGRDPDLNKRLSVAEQVDNVIKEAKDLDNLAVLYEGWTPWV